MNREIKFRVWHKLKKEMLLEPQIEPRSINLMNGWFNSERSKVLYDFMQYTGFKDEADQEIYEGDILSDYQRKGAVTWDRGCGMWLFADHAQLFNAEQRFIVLGNIYENPELLK